MKFTSREHFEESLAKAVSEDLRKDVVQFKKPAPAGKKPLKPAEQAQARQKRNRQVVAEASPKEDHHHPEPSGPFHSAWGNKDAHAPAYVHAIHTLSSLDPKNPKHDKWRKLYQNMADAHKAIHNAIKGNVKIGEDEKK